MRRFLLFIVQNVVQQNARGALGQNFDHPFVFFTEKMLLILVYGLQNSNDEVVLINRYS
jgi:hypothetical protein